MRLPSFLILTLNLSVLTTQSEAPRPRKVKQVANQDFQQEQVDDEFFLKRDHPRADENEQDLQSEGGRKTSTSSEVLYSLSQQKLIESKLTIANF